MKSITLFFLLVISWNCQAQQSNDIIDYQNATYHNMEFEGKLYSELRLKDGYFIVLEEGTDTNSVEFSNRYFENTGEKYIPGKSLVESWAFEQEGWIYDILETDLNLDNSKEVIVTFNNGRPGVSGHSWALFVFQKNDPELKPIAHLQLGSRSNGGLATKSEYCEKCKGIEIKNGKLNIYVYDDPSALDWAHYKIETYQLEKNGLKKIKTSKKFSTQ